MRKKIKHLLIERNLSVKELAEMLGYTSQHLSFIINGRSDGTQTFWDKFKEVLKIPDSEIEFYRKKE